MNNGFEYIDESNKIDSTNELEEEKNKSEFIDGLPDWDIEPPYEVIRRNE